MAAPPFYAEGPEMALHTPQTLGRGPARAVSFLGFRGAAK